MEFRFNSRVESIFLYIKDKSKELDITKIGSEYLLLAMYRYEDSLCRFLFNEYDISESELDEETNKIEVLRKNDKEYTDSLYKILEYAKKLATLEISDEHLFMGILNNENSIAYNILVRLGLDINDLKNDVLEIYDFKNNNIDLPYLVNMSAKASNKELNEYVNIDDYIDRMMVILKRKNKNNPILIGNAGVGKTAIVEGFAKYILDKKLDYEIVSLNISSMLSGTKYRGDFEERLDNTVKEIVKRKNVVVFIDEIHTIVGAGTTESSLDVSNMLKPYLARSDFKVIGATTINEYHKTIEHDKALNRRFEAIFVSEPTLSQTKKILYGIRKSYEDFHKVKIDNKTLDYLLEAANNRIINKYRPDKCIDALDELLSYLSLNNKSRATIKDVDNILDRMLGYRIKNNNINFKILNKYLFLYTNSLNFNKPLINILYEGNKAGYSILIDDLKSLFGITDEMILDIDFSNYKEAFMITSLIGAPPGYVGYEDEGILSKHIMSYPISIISLDNIDSAYPNIYSLFVDMMRNGYFYDRKGNYISVKNTIFITKNQNINKYIGFLNKEKASDIIYDEILKYDNDYIDNLNNKYKDVFKKYNMELDLEISINRDNKKEIDNILYDLALSNKRGKIKIFKENNTIIYK